VLDRRVSPPAGHPRLQRVSFRPFRLLTPHRPRRPLILTCRQRRRLSAPVGRSPRAYFRCASGLRTRSVCSPAG